MKKCQLIEDIVICKLKELRLLTARNSNIHAFDKEFKLLSKHLDISEWSLGTAISIHLRDDYNAIMSLLIKFCVEHKNEPSSMAVRLCVEMLFWFKEFFHKVGLDFNAHITQTNHVEALRLRIEYWHYLNDYEKDDLELPNEFRVLIGLLGKQVVQLIDVVDSTFFVVKVRNIMDNNITSQCDTLKNACLILEYIVNPKFISAQQQWKLESFEKLLTDFRQEWQQFSRVQYTNMELKYGERHYQFDYDQPLQKLMDEHKNTLSKWVRRTTILIEGKIHNNPDACRDLRLLRMRLLALIDLLMIQIQVVIQADYPQQHLIAINCFEPIQQLTQVCFTLQDLISTSLQRLGIQLANQEDYDAVQLYIQEKNRKLSHVQLIPPITIQPSSRERFFMVQHDEFSRRIGQLLTQLTKGKYQYVNSVNKPNSILYCHLDVWSLVRAHESERTISVQSMNIIIDYLKNHPEVEVINFRDQYIDLEAFTKLINYLIKSPTNIRRLDLWHCTGIFPNCNILNIFNRKAAESLSKLLKKKNSSLRELSINDCGLTTQDMNILTSGLAENNVLEHLDFAFNPSIGDKGLLALFKEVEKHNSLWSLSVAGTGMTISGAFELWEVVKKNKKLTHVVLDNNPFPHNKGEYIEGLSQAVLTSMDLYDALVKVELLAHMQSGVNWQNEEKPLTICLDQYNEQRNSQHCTSRNHNINRGTQNYCHNSIPHDVIINGQYEDFSADDSVEIIKKSNKEESSDPLIAKIGVVNEPSCSDENITTSVTFFPKTQRSSFRDTPPRKPLPKCPVDKTLNKYATRDENGKFLMEEVTGHEETVNANVEGEHDKFHFHDLLTPEFEMAQQQAFEEIEHRRADEKFSAELPRPDSNNQARKRPLPRDDKGKEEMSSDDENPTPNNRDNWY